MSAARALAALSLLFACDQLVRAQPADSEVERVEVTAPVPLAGSPTSHGAPPAVQEFSREALDRVRALGVPGLLQRLGGSVSLSEAQNNPLQPDVYYRGFSASPLLGAPQGLVVYLNGIRFNDVFGDTVNWDLLPESLIERFSLVGGASPAYGLNALGGAIVAETRTGFSSPGQRVSVSYGAFERARASASAGGHGEHWGYLAAIDHFSEDGWRDFSRSESSNGYLTLGRRGEGRSLDVFLSAATSTLRGNGASPEWLLRERREAVFTHPDITDNRLFMGSVNYRHSLGADAYLRVAAFARRLTTEGFNGDASEFEPCGTPAARWLCGDDDGGFVLDQFGQRVSADLDAVNNRNDRNQRSHGATLEIGGVHGLGGLAHDWVVGLDALNGDTEFDSQVELARLNAVRGTVATGSFVPASAVALSAQLETRALYLSHTTTIGQRLRVTVSSRFDRTRVRLRDDSGRRPALRGSHRFERTSGGLGAVWTLGERHELYGGTHRTARAPTPVELACSHPQAPCLLPNTFLADPPLDDVVAQGGELGIRGEAPYPWLTRWRLGLFHSRSRDDIVFQTVGGISGNRGFFANASDTLRRGIEAQASGTLGPGAPDAAVRWFARYNYLEAEYGDSFLASSPRHPAAVDGVVRVAAGSRLPAIPRHTLKLGAAYRINDRLEVSTDLRVASARYLRGDEANLLDPISGHAVANLSLSYQPTDRLTLFVDVTNVFDRDYESFGLLGESDEVLDDAPPPGPRGDRFLGPGEPRGVWFGVRYRVNSRGA